LELIVFDLDGTLLDAKSQVSAHTRDTLQLLRQRGIAYTVATGRTLHAARDLLQDHNFTLPHIYKNGVVIWRPDSDHYSHHNLLSAAEILSVLAAFMSVAVTPFVFTLQPKNRTVVFHPPMRTDAERRLAALFARDRGLELLPIADMPATAEQPRSIWWPMPALPWRVATYTGWIFTTAAPARAVQSLNSNKTSE
jgi:5-amino-6-(5-phospho-D-ribitylamino)uracil phosphatase